MHIDKPSIMTQSIPFGTRIGRDQFRLVHRNNSPELVMFTELPLRKCVRCVLPLLMLPCCFFVPHMRRAHCSYSIIHIFNVVVVFFNEI